MRSRSRHVSREGCLMEQVGSLSGGASCKRELNRELGLTADGRRPGKEGRERELLTDHDHVTQ